MKKMIGMFAYLTAFVLCALPSLVLAQGAAPELYGVREVVVDYARFDNPKASDSCGLSREMVSSILSKSFSGTSFPAVMSIEAKPPVLGVARIQLIPQISTYTNDSLDCISWISLTAENKANIVVPPVQTARNLRVIYWQSRMLASSGRTTHEQKVIDALKSMADDLIQRYRVAQPPEISIK